MTPSSDAGVIVEGLKKAGYFPDESLAAALWLSTVLGRPLLLEGEDGVGKTSIAAAFAAMRGSRLIGSIASCLRITWKACRNCLI